MADEVANKNPWHIVEPSPWPAVGSLGAFFMAAGGVWYMHAGVLWGFGVGAAFVLISMWGWWHDVVKEGVTGGHHTPPVQSGLRVGMVLFIFSEVMFFIAFFWAFFHSSMPELNYVASPIWPPEGVVPLNAWEMPFMNTLILLSSGGTVTAAHHFIRDGNKPRAIFWIGMTVLLGVIFLGTQAYEFKHAAFGFTDGIYSTTFYMATGFHGLHVFIGVCFLTVCFFRAISGHFKPNQHVGFEAAAWYWHFVDVVWLFLFTSIYWWGGSGYQPG
jgi:cytochrome c oxidase subunit 3